MVARIWEWRWGNRELSFNGCKVSVFKMNKVWKGVVNIMAKLCINAQYVLCIAKFKTVNLIMLTVLESESEVAQSCPTLCDPMDCSLSGSSVYVIFQARVLEWIAISLLQGILLTQESNPGFPHCRQMLYHLSHQGIPQLYPLSR